MQNTNLNYEKVLLILESDLQMVVLVYFISHTVQSGGQPWWKNLQKKKC